jgi:tyrosyl-DNA phosphodiesterase 2
MSESTTSPVMQALSAALNSGPAQRLGHDYYKPRPQNFWIVGEDGEWQSTYSSYSSTRAGSPLNPGATRLISWNIDVLVGHAEERMRAALIHLEELVSSTPSETPVVVLLQEIGQSDLVQIRAADWIKNRFNITEHDHKNWTAPHYGTTTLIDRRLSIASVFRVPWVTKFDRDGLFVDIAVTNKQPANADPKVLRLCNTHLESLVADPPVRPLQLAAASPYLKKPNVVGALLAGDLNAIQPFDRTLHSDNGLKDTYLELGGQEDSDDGYTWGYQVAQWMKDKFGCSRMDKILFHGAVQPSSFMRIGMGVKVAEEDRERVEKEIEGAWVTDHYGVMGDFNLLEGWELQTHDADGEQVRSKLS